ncbi:CFI-box-CTERM domain-containing protein [Nitrosopumilus sp. K4]|uniref:CFI-box-CTERM domain-containing protein n=1 Tax=Nitrosopumilus sp. K4 TaxID=2795383 RepID=UPI002011E4F1|nr:CFI-box-CTERM domain-containing protein [Nitrosopumilus sp. K4]
MKTKWVFLILSVTLIPISAIAQIPEQEGIIITVTSDAKAKVAHTLFPEPFVSSVDVNLISDQISGILALDEDNILLVTTQDKDMLNIASLGATKVDLTYNANIISYKSGIFKINYHSDEQSKVILPPLSKLVSLNTIPMEVNEREFVLPPGEIVLSYSIRQVTSQEFSISQNDAEYLIEFITGAKIEELSADSNEIRFNIKDKAVILGIIPTSLFLDIQDASLNEEKVDFQKFFQNSTHSWIRIDPHEKGTIKIFNKIPEKTPEGGGCLIATATFGTEMAPQVQQLRELRDSTVLSTESGTSFMSGFNQIYYSFSPIIADFERQNPIFKETVRISITPMLFSLSILDHVEINSEQDMIGYGVVAIMMNIGMYIFIPAAIIYKVQSIRTSIRPHSNQSIISKYTINTALKYSLFGLIVLTVLIISVNSAFAQEAPSEDPEELHPIQAILDMAQESANEAVGDDSSSTASTLLEMAELEYQKAIDALNSGDVDGAEESALVAMALFEDATETAGGDSEQLVLDQLPPGFGAAVDSTADNENIQGQGLGVGSIPPGIMKQLLAQDIFNIQNEIVESDFDVENLQNLASSNNVNLDFTPYQNSVNQAKALLAAGDIPNAKNQLAAAEQIKDELIQQMQEQISEDNPQEEEFIENTIAEINQMLENRENLGLTQKAIRELQNALEVLESGDTDAALEITKGNSEYAKEIRESRGNSGNAPPGQGDETPGNSGNAPPGQGDETPGNSGNAPPGQGDETPGNSGNGGGPSEIPGFGAAGENPSEEAFENGQGVGLGKIPPGLAELFGYTEAVNNGGGPSEIPGFGAAGENPSEEAFENGQGVGLGKIPPGLAAIFESIDFNYDDDWEDDPVNSDYDRTVNPGYLKSLEKQLDARQKAQEAREAAAAKINNRLQSFCDEHPSHQRCTDGQPGQGGGDTPGQGGGDTPGQGGGDTPGQGGGDTPGQGGGDTPDKGNGKKK